MTSNARLISVPPADIELTPREMQVLRLAADGHSSKSTGRALDIRETTVKAHRKTLIRRLRSKNITHAVAMALRQGVIR